MYLLNALTTTFVGVRVHGEKDKFWRVECPCGVEAFYPINSLPETDTKHPCGHPDHWSVRYMRPTATHAKVELAPRG